MRFSEIVKEAREWLQRDGRLRYRSLQREFDLDEEALADLRDELIEGQRVAMDEEGKVLVWVGVGDATGVSIKTELPSQAPASYTPQHLAERILAEQAAMESRGAAGGERKTITALFADLKGSTALIEGLDPEDARAIIDPALQLMMDAVHRYNGYVAQALGDGIFALFGAPIAHEDHPQRALYAALRMQEEMRAYSDQSRLTGGIPLQMRVGINTGEVVVRSIRKDDLHTDYVPVGHSTNLAARMEQIATPGSIVISGHTQKLTDGYFELKALGAADIKGVEEPLNVYEVLGAGPLRTRLQVSARRGLTRFVGRQSELDQMERALEQAEAGHGQIVGVMGEPGLGKSRLFYEFKLTSQSGCLVLEAFSVSHGKASPYLPIIDLLNHYFQIEPVDDERTRKEKVNGKVITLDRNLEDIVPYLFSLLGIDEPESSLQQMDPPIRRQRTFEALKKLLLRESLNQPLLLIFEDLHWIDNETQGFLDTLSESVASAQLLLLVNYRPEYRHDWVTKTYYTQLRLAPLGKAEAEELLTFLLGADASMNALKPLILEKTEGTPFFIEEVVQTLVEEGALGGARGSYRLETTPTELQLSPTVQGVLAARIDRLSAEEKALLQQLAVIGRQFPVSLVKQVVPQSEADLYRVLASLQAKEFLYEQPAFPEVEYLFKHALTQEVAYGTVLQEQRKALHEQTGHAMEALYRDSLEEHYSELAYHYRRSENTEKAVEYLHLAGQQAVQRSANEEALNLLTTALARLQTLPNSPERARGELALQLSLGVPLSITTGDSSPETEQAFLRARELCEQVGERAQLFPVLRGLYQVCNMRAEYTTARELGEQVLTLAQQEQDPEMLMVAHGWIDMNSFFLGEGREALRHAEQAFSLYDSQQHCALGFRYGYDPGVMSQLYKALALWFLGYPEQAYQELGEARALAHEVAHPNSVALALNDTAWLHQFRQEAQPAREWAEADITYSMDHGIPICAAWGTTMRGWALAMQGQGEEGIGQLRQGLADFQAMEAKVLWSQLLGMLAQAYGETGQIEEGLNVLAEALAHVGATGEGLYEAELSRLKGKLLLHAREQSPESRAKEAEACFQQAITIARRQSGKSWELRAATSLARLWQQQGKTAEAYQLLSEIYNWFTEGFDTPDLKDAKALLQQLS